MPRLTVRWAGGRADTPRFVVRGFGGRPILPAPTVDGTTFFDGLRTKLKAVPELAPITEVYFRRPEPRAAHPYIVVSPITNVPEFTNGGPYWTRDLIQFVVVAAGPTADVDAEQYGWAAVKGLAPKKRDDAGRWVVRPKIKTTYAYEMAALPGGVWRMEQPGRGVGNQNVFAFYFQYTFLVGREMGVNWS